MALTLTPTYPGIFVERRPTLFFGSVVSLYERTYIAATTTLGEPMVPVEIYSMDDFYNQLGSSDAIILNAVEFYLRNTNIGLTIIPIKPYYWATVTIAAPVAAGAYTLTILGELITIIIPDAPAPTLESATKAIITAINNNTAINRFVEAEYKLSGDGAFVYDGNFYLRGRTSTTFTLGAGTANLTVSPVTVPNEPTYHDWIRACDHIPRRLSEEPLGILSIPQAAFLPSKWERNQVRRAMILAARRVGWFPILDPPIPDVVRSPLELKREFEGVTGYASVYYPYGIDFDGDLIPPSVMIATFAMRAYQTIGIQAALAGDRFPIEGLSDLAYTIKLSRYEVSDRAFMADYNLNPILFKKGRGFIPYSNKTLSSEIKYSHDVIVMNSLERSLYATLDASGVLFASLGNRGQTIDQIGGLLATVCQRYYNEGALFGELPEQAYSVICALENQVLEDLQNNRIRAEVYAAPTAIAEQILVATMRVQVGDMAKVLTATGSVAA